VDEAQNLGRQRLEELRLLSNLNADQDFLLQMILVGQPELRDLMQTPQLRQLAQRIGADYHIGGLTVGETMAYVQHRLKVAGGSEELFTPEAVRLAFAASRGIPRLINQLCDTALVYAYSEQKPVVDELLMREAIRDRTRGGIFPARNVRAVAETPPAPRTGSDA